MSVYLTAKLKVHNPSRRKRAILDRALEEYTRAYAELLGWANANLSVLEEKGEYNGRFTENSIRSVLPAPSTLNHYHLHSSARDSLLIDVAGLSARTSSCTGKTPSLPSLPAATPARRPIPTLWRSSQPSSTRPRRRSPNP